ncbi:coiled-coil domain-containing protein 157 isoform X2 [Lingula anatina]|uniref:Coiled-coil domain-containing protein 157 isoform X2 n=1 Tax=Lingula anatina TaxID=7574 RepID=A0A1S3JCA9_LINAN|nr:coiled-coil domain-containing protein 157 isoform X2 [Lingula anatina]|eukprot:XP_013408045.1 coiled-coil domain-containing protein 157 isoform X2 [Lingula anatina]
MAHLLGSKFCIESLRSDVTDLQAAVSDVFSRTGPTNSTSWKFPDKIGSEIDIEDLLETYDYSEDEEERQVSHISLLELVIDRLVLLIQGMSKYADQTLASSSRSTPANLQGSSVSIGLTVRKYWNKMVHLHANVQQLQSEIKSKNRKIQTLEDAAEHACNSPSNPHIHLKPSEGLNPKSPAQSGLIPPSNQDSFPACKDISKDCSNKSSQTIETAFVPCEACEKVQHCLKEIGENVVNVCQTQGLPSALAKYKKQISGLDWMTANDVTRWSSEQNKDLVKINKHLSHLESTIEPLKSDLAVSQESCKKLQAKVDDFDKEMSLERQTQTAQRKQYEQKIKDIEQQNNEAVCEVQRQNDKLRSDKKELETNVVKAREELASTQKRIEDLEATKVQLLKDLQENASNSSEIQTLEGVVSDLKSQLNDVKEKFDTTTKELAKQQVVNKTLSRNKEALQGKQESLLQRIDALDQDNESLKQRVEEIEDERDSLQENLDKVTEEKEKLVEEMSVQQIHLTELNKEKSSLEQAMQQLEQNIAALTQDLQEAQERERLLVEYPDLNGPVNPDLAGSGDIALDMENQVKANHTRIQILEEQNTALRNSITKVLAAQAKGNSAAGSSGPVPLWRPDASRSQQKQSQQPHYEQRGGHTRNIQENRPRITSAGKASPLVAANSSSLAAYKQLKKAGLLPGPSSKGKVERPSSTGSGSGYSPQDVFTCGKCDKVYTTLADLDLHKSYCYGHL